MTAPPPAPEKPQPEPLLITPRRPITRYRPIVVAAGLGVVILLVGAAFIVGMGEPAKRAEVETPAASDPGDAPTPLEARLPARYDQPGALPPAGTAGLPAPESGVGQASQGQGASMASPGAPSPEVQRARQEAQAARASAPFFAAAGDGGRRSALATPAAGGSTSASVAIPVLSTATAVSPAALSPKEQFIEASAARGPKAAVLAKDPISPYEVKPGTLISAAMITGINSDLPGPVIAQVTEPVFDHRTGRRVLIPQGARLIGRYDSQVGYGQERVLVVWSQLVFPSGRTVDLGAMVGLDAAGVSGLTGRIERHGGRLARAIGLSTLIAMAGAAAQNSAARHDNNVVIQDGAGAIASSASQTGQRLVERDLQRSPTLMIAPGQSVRVLIDRTLDLPPEEETTR